MTLGPEHDGYWNYPELNEIYTIEFVMYDGAVTLEEIDNSHIDKEIHARGQNDLSGILSHGILRR